MIKESLRTKILNGSLKDYKNYLAGCYQEFYITIDFAAPYYLVRVNASSPNDSQNALLAAYLEQQKNSNQALVKSEVYNHAFLLTIKEPNLKKNLPDVLNGLLNPILTYLSANGYATGCENCATQTEQLNCYEINGMHHYVCNSCASQIQGALQQNQQAIRSQKSNLIPGLVGALIGSLIGAVLWVVIYRLGYIAGIAGAVTAVCALKGYELLGKNLDRKGVVGSVIIMIIVLYFANRVAWSLEAYTVFKESGATFSDCYRSLSDILELADATGAYIKDLLIGYGLTALASYRNIIDAFKSSSGSFSIKKVN